MYLIKYSNHNDKNGTFVEIIRTNKIGNLHDLQKRNFNDCKYALIYKKSMTGDYAFLKSYILK